MLLVIKLIAFHVQLINTAGLPKMVPLMVLLAIVTQLEVSSVVVVHTHSIQFHKIIPSFSLVVLSLILTTDQLFQVITFTLILTLMLKLTQHA